MLVNVSLCLQAPARRKLWWSWTESKAQADKQANRTHLLFAVASAMLGYFIIAVGGADIMQLQLETLDTVPFNRLIIDMWLFWECYFAGRLVLWLLLK